jgi:hypothetical protein
MLKHFKLGYLVAGLRSRLNNMLDILKRAGVAAGLAAVIVLAITIVPIVYQIKSTNEQNARIDALEATITTLTVK